MPKLSKSCPKALFGTFPDQRDHRETPCGYLFDHFWEPQGGVAQATTDDTGATPLTISAFHGHEAVVAALLAAGADADKKDKRGDNPLVGAAMGNHAAAARALLAGGADKAVRTPHGTAAEVAAKKEHHELARLLQ